MTNDNSAKVPIVFTLEFKLTLTMSILTLGKAKPKISNLYAK